MPGRCTYWCVVCRLGVGEGYPVDVPLHVLEVGLGILISRCCVAGAGGSGCNSPSLFICSRLIELSPHSKIIEQACYKINRLGNGSMWRNRQISSIQESCYLMTNAKNFTGQKSMLSTQKPSGISISLLSIGLYDEVIVTNVKYIYNRTDVPECHIIRILLCNLCAVIF